MLRNPLILVTCVIVLCVPAKICASAPTAAELLAAYEKSLEVYSRAIYTASSKSSYYGFALPAGTVAWEQVERVWHDGNRHKYLLDWTSRMPPFRDKTTPLPAAGGKTITNRERYEQVWGDKGRVVVGFDRSNPNQPDGVVANLDELPESLRVQAKTFFHAAITYGWLRYNDGVPLPQILRESALTTRKETVQEREVWVLEGVGAWGYHALWLDPNLGFVAVRIVQRKKGTDRSDGGNLLASQPRNTLVLPQADFSEIVRQLDATKVEKLATGYWVTRATLDEHMRFTNGQSVRISTQFDFSQIDPNPDFSTSDPFVISTPIADGTEVQVDDRPNIRYEWRGGKIVKSWNQEWVERLVDLSFLPGPWVVRLLLFVTFSLLLVGLLILIGYRLGWPSGKRG
jgi:hypothetical protein